MVNILAVNAVNVQMNQPVIEMRRLFPQRKSRMETLKIYLEMRDDKTEKEIDIDHAVIFCFGKRHIFSVSIAANGKYKLHNGIDAATDHLLEFANLIYAEAKRRRELEEVKYANWGE